MLLGPEDIVVERSSVDVLTEVGIGGLGGPCGGGDDADSDVGENMFS